MPLSEASTRREVHHRSIEMHTYERDDGLFDVEARLIDRKPFPYIRLSSSDPVPAGKPLHDLSVRMTVDADYVVRAIEASSDSTPWELCKEAEKELSVMVGEKLVRGWSAKVKERLRGAAGCTHLAEMLIPMSTVALQGIWGVRVEKVRSVGADGIPTKIDSCFAYDRRRDVVKMLWPKFHVGK